MTDYPIDREFLGQLVRETWIKWAKEQDNPKPHWLTKWVDLPESMKEVDRRIGEAVANVSISILEREIKRLQKGKPLPPTGTQRDTLLHDIAQAAANAVIMLKRIQPGNAVHKAKGIETIVGWIERKAREAVSEGKSSPTSGTHRDQPR